MDEMLFEKCDNCHRLYETVYRVPDLVWEAVSKKKDGAGMLCIQCCDAIAREKGAGLWWEARIGRYPTEVPEG